MSQMDADSDGTISKEELQLYCSLLSMNYRRRLLQRAFTKLEPSRFRIHGISGVLGAPPCSWILLSTLYLVRSSQDQA
eukprot:scaffold146_cov374-Prasinococcus_capsulatus_cf.AAC.13